MTEHERHPLIEALAVAQEVRDVGRGITCPRCGMTSHHPQDVAEGYCGHCHDWTQGG